MSLKKRGETWFCDLVHGQQRIRRSLETSDKKEAQRRHDELKAELWKQKRTVNVKTWQDACIAWLKVAERSESERYSLRALAYDDRPLAECTAESFQAALADKTASTYQRYRGMITAILNLAKEQKWIEDVPRLMVRKTPPGRKRFLTEAEWTALHNELPEHLRPMAVFGLATGLRQSNVTQLRWSEVDMQRQVAWVHPDEAKGKEPIGIPLSAEAMKVLQGQNGKDDVFVFTYRGKPIGKIKNAWQNACARAGVGTVTITVDAAGKKHRKYKGFTWHGLRHTWASWHTMSGTPIEVLQQLGAWADLRMVQGYAHLAPDHLRGFANNAKPWRGGRTLSPEKDHPAP